MLSVAQRIGPLAGCLFLLLSGSVHAAQFSIPPAQIDPGKIYYGQAAGFDKAGEVNFQEAIVATPEYETMRKEKVDYGSGRYWVLQSQASDRVVHAVSDFADATDFDLIAAVGYLGKLTPPISAENVTAQVIGQMLGRKAKVPAPTEQTKPAETNVAAADSAGTAAAPVATESAADRRKREAEEKAARKAAEKAEREAKKAAKKAEADRKKEEARKAKEAARAEKERKKQEAEQAKQTPKTEESPVAAPAESAAAPPASS